MKLNLLLTLHILTLLTACGQTSKYVDNIGVMVPKPVYGDTVEQLGTSIMVIYQDKDENYWFGSWETGVYRYDGKTLVNFNTKHGLPYNRIDEIKEDSSGNLYFTSCSPESATTKFDGNMFKVLPAIATNRWELNATDIWFRPSYQYEKVYRYDGDTLHELVLQKPPNLPNRFEIYSIYKDIKGNVWFGANPVGVCRYDGEKIDWITEEDVTEFRNEGANGVRSILEDANGDFWFNTEFRYSIYDSTTEQSDKFYTRHKSLGNLDGSEDSNLDEYLSCVKDNQDNLWFVTYRDGVWKYDGKDITHYPVQLEGKPITTFYIYKDNGGDLWVGTHENGVFVFNGTSFEKFVM